MFQKNSRYADVETVSQTQQNGKTVRAVKLRRLPETTGSEFTVRGNTRLDLIAHQKYGAPALFWRIADANTELQARALVQESGRTIFVPESAP